VSILLTPLWNLPAGLNTGHVDALVARHIEATVKGFVPRLDP
jgi:hypothetical protein